MDRFWSKVNKHGPRAGRLGRCWVWTGARNSGGYGSFWRDGRIESAHRVAWGDVPEGMDVLHRCDNPPCVRHSHLFLGTQAINNQDMAAKGRARSGHGAEMDCVHGHSYDDSNTYIESSRPHRMCRACGRARALRRRVAA